MESMRKKLLVVALFLSTHFLVLIEYQLISARVFIAGELECQFYAVFSANVVVSLLLALFSTTFRLKYLFLGSILVFSSIISVAFGNALSIRFSLLLIVMFAGFLCRSVAAIALSTGLYLFSVLLFKDIVTPWTKGIETISQAEMLAMFVVGSILALLLMSRLEILRRNEKLTRQLEKLKTDVEELSAANLGYSTFLQFAQQQASAEERNRITREIHDGIGYTLTNVMMLSEAAMDHCDAGQMRLAKALDAIRVQARTGLYDTRRALRLLRSAESHLPRGVAAVRQMTDYFQRATGVEVKTNVLVSDSIIEHPAIFLTIYRFIQESLTNAFRHGHATRVEVRFNTDEEWLIVSVSDNGKGTDQVKEGIGLQGMRERIEAVGGELSYHTAYGFSVAARLPIQEAKTPKMQRQELENADEVASG
jgi:signal transduction histidine kinase